MKFTNKHNLPQYLCDWLIHDDYDHNYDPYTISATTLMKPIKSTVLALRHHEELEMDVVDLIPSRLGSAIHDSIEQIETPNVSKENRIKRTMDIQGTTYTITGKYDVLEEDEGISTLRDIKTTSTWTYIFKSKDEDYKKQLSIYRWLLSKEKNINSIGYIDFFFTDWQSSKAKYDPTYPSNRIHNGYRVNLMSLQEVEKYIQNRLEDIHKYRFLKNDEMPDCTMEELWAKDPKYAVMKPKAKKATRVFDNEKDAQQYILSKNLKAKVEYRPPKVKRCLYCNVAPVCEQFQQLVRNGLIDNS